jgi:hypothetical protein
MKAFWVLVAMASLMLSTQAVAETSRFAIMRNGEQIGTQTIDINRSGPETTVKMSTDLEVKVLFVTAYRLQQTSVEKWVEGRLVSLKSSTNKNGTRRDVSVTETPAGLQVSVDGKPAQTTRDIMPASLWNAEVLRRSQLLDTQEGEIVPLSVTDNGFEQVTVKSRPVKARHYTLKSRMDREVWYDDQSRLVRVRIIGSDGSTIIFQPI